MQGAEHRLAGPMPKQKAARHVINILAPCKQNGPYSIGGMSVHTASGKQKTLKDDYESGQLAISEVEFKRQMGYLQAPKPEPRKQLTLGDMFRKRPGAVDSASSSAAADELREEEESSSSSESETGKSDLGNDEEQHSELLEQEARSKEGDVTVDSIIVADEIAEWVETVLEDTAPLDPSELASLAADGLKKARKSKDYRSTILFAALTDFYRWMPRMGRLAAALRVAKNHGRGPAFQRVLCAQARFFEANGALKPGHYGRGRDFMTTLMHRTCNPNSELEDIVWVKNLKIVNRFFESRFGGFGSRALDLANRTMACSKRFNSFIVTSRTSRICSKSCAADWLQIIKEVGDECHFLPPRAQSH
ncbi:hypothetical protein B0H10DRAFT_2189833 [Mycena sp. CBHHK59/15]|nr:hypothetical protein B0H10DRAFT_2189833 [Mycena sp. CBHHK59/15]